VNLVGTLENIKMEDAQEFSKASGTAKKKKLRENEDSYAKSIFDIFDLDFWV